MFELVFVGGWVWIIADIIRDEIYSSRRFFVFSGVKATVFWFAFIALLTAQVG